MTGYGRSAIEANSEGAPVRFAVEVRSVNHRGLDLKIRSDQPDAFCEVEITRVLRGVIDRGAVSVNVRDERPARGLLDLGGIRRMYEALDAIRREAGLSQPVDLGTVAAFMAQAAGPGGPATSAHGHDLWLLLRPAVEAAVAELAATRAREGGALRADLETRLNHFSAVVDQIENAVRPVPARFARRLQDRLASLNDTPGFDAGRVAQEVALMAERLDVSEEVVRLRTHLDHFRGLLDAEGSVGRKLDFVIQEIGREINTIGSKAQDATVAGQVIEGKAELEKIREQAQNIE